MKFTSIQAFGLLIIANLLGGTSSTLAMPHFGGGGSMPHFNPPPHVNPPPHINPPPHVNPPPHINPPPHVNPPPHINPPHVNPPSHVNPPVVHNPPGQPSGPHNPPVAHNPPAPPASAPHHVEPLPRGGEVRHYADGSRTVVHQDGSQVVHSGGRTTSFDSAGKPTSEAYGGTKINYHADGSRTVQRGNQTFNEKIVIRNNQSIVVRNYSYHSSLINGNLSFNRSYGSFGCQYWHSPLRFYESSLVFGAFEFALFGGGYGNPYNPIWGYNYWNNNPWPSYGWYHHYSGWYWRPYGYWARNYYRPSYALVDWIIASNLEVAWESRLEAAREAARQANADRVSAAESEEEAQQIRAQVDAEAAQAAQAASDSARAAAETAQAAADVSNQASGSTAVNQEVQDQLASQVEQVTQDRQNSTPMNTGFEAALKDDRYVFLVSSNSGKTYDNGSNGSCILEVGDMIQREQMIGNSGLVSLKVKVSQLDSCKAGSTITMTVEDLSEIYNAFHENLDTGAKQLADKNQSSSPLM